MSQKDYRGRGTVKMNPLGPHFYIDVEEGEAAPSMPDAITNIMNERLAEMDSEHGWPITHMHIEAHTAITEVSWTPASRVAHDCDYTLEDFDVSLDWYSRKELWELDY